MATFFAVAVVFANDSSVISKTLGACCFGIASAWPRLAGFISMNAKVCSSSYTLKDGISPEIILQKIQSSDMGLSYIVSVACVKVLDLHH